MSITKRQRRIVRWLLLSPVIISVLVVIGLDIYFRLFPSISGESKIATAVLVSMISSLINGPMLIAGLWLAYRWDYFGVPQK